MAGHKNDQMNSRGFSPLERRANRILQRFPLLRRVALGAYRSVTPLIFRPPHKLNLRGNYVLTDVESGRVISPQENTQIPVGKEAESETFVGYYDVTPWSLNSDHFFYHRKPNQYDHVEIVVARPGGDAHTVTSSSAWNYQQGSRTTWYSHNSLVFNSLRGNRAVAVVTDISNAEILQTFDHPIQALSPDRRSFVSVSTARLNAFNPAYGYTTDRSTIRPDTEDGLWIVDTRSGKSDLLLTIHDLVKNNPDPTLRSESSKLNHATYSPDSKHVAVIHRWYWRGRRSSRLLVVNIHTRQSRILLDTGMVSHYTWLDNERLLVFARKENGTDGFIVVDIEETVQDIDFYGRPAALGDAHPYRIPNSSDIIVDSYPDRYMLQALGVVNLNTKQYEQLGEFISPRKYRGIRRCDLHPRSSDKGDMISFDSTFTGRRRTYTLQIP